jgi:hypothetical protein
MFEGKAINEQDNQRWDLGFNESPAYSICINFFLILFRRYRHLITNEIARFALRFNRACFKHEPYNMSGAKQTPSKSRQKELK